MLGQKAGLGGLPQSGTDGWLHKHYAGDAESRFDDLMPVPVPAEWTKQSECLKYGVEYTDHHFWPDPWGNIHPKAAAICAVCPVKAECYEAGVDETEGVWGGTTPKERRVIRLGLLGDTA